MEQFGSREALNDVTCKAYADENLDSGPALSDCGDEPMVKGEARKWRNRARIKDNEIKLLRKMVASAKAEVAKKENNISAMANRLEEVGNQNQNNQNQFQNSTQFNQQMYNNGNMMAIAQRIMVLEQQELPFAREQQRKATMTINALQNQVQEQDRRLRGADEEHRQVLAARDGRIAAQGAAMGALQQRHTALQQQHQDLQQQHQQLQHQSQQMRLLVAQLMNGAGDWAGTLGGAAPSPGVPGGATTTPERRANTAHLLQPYMPSTWGVAAGVGPSIGNGQQQQQQQQQVMHQGGAHQADAMALAVAMSGLPQLPSPSRLPAGFSESNSPIIDFLAPRNDGLMPIPCPTFVA